MQETASHESVMSQSLVTSGRATIGHPLVMKRSFFSTKLQGHHQVSEFNMCEHFLGSNKGFEILENSVQNPLFLNARNHFLKPFIFST
jgi:hypothetical protein